jgi:hypothetical protein
VRCEDRAADEQGFARRRQTEILEQNPDRYGEIAVIRDVVVDAAEEAQDVTSSAM